MQQIWKTIDGFNGIYQVSNMGRVKSLNFKRTGKEQIMKHKVVKIQHKNRVYKQHQIALYKDGKVKWFMIHKLVYEAFKGKIPKGFQIDHKSNDPQDNRLENLQLLTRSENNKKRFQDNSDFKNPLEVLHPKKSILCLNNGVVYESITDASKKLNLYDTSICAVLKGRRKQTNGYKFIYAIDYHAIDNNTLIQMELF